MPANADEREVISISSDSDEEDFDRGLEAPLRALNDASRTQFQVAIATAPDERVRQAFSALVDSIPAVSERVFRMLVAVKRHADSAEDEDDEEEGQGEEDDSARRQKVAIVPRWWICANCDEEFDAGEGRQRGECLFHPGA